MRTFLVDATRFLEQPLDLAPRVLLVAATACLILTFVLPLWNMTMFAPQYPHGLRLQIYAHSLAGAGDGQDLKEINLLNHYIGMRPLAEDDFMEFKWMPFVIGGIGLLILRAAVHGTIAALVDAGVVFFYFTAFSSWSFGYKLYRYGHDLAPTAAVKVPPFMPPMFGYGRVGNFEVYSYPAAATYAMVAVLALLGLAFVLAWRSARRGPAYAAAT